MDRYCVEITKQTDLIFSTDFALMPLCNGTVILDRIKFPMDLAKQL